jgi:hypothetical protein
MEPSYSLQIESRSLKSGSASALVVKLVLTIRFTASEISGGPSLAANVCGRTRRDEHQA